MRHGIVLRSFLPARHGCLLFDSTEGVMSCTILARPGTFPLVHGAIIKGEKYEQDRFSFKNAQLVALPAPWVLEDILFLHHMLEMVGVFVLPGEVVPEILHLLRCLYRPIPEHVESESYKLIILGSFFVAIGMHQEQSREDPLYLISQLQSTNVDKRSMYRFSLARWITRCVESHPSARFFKTHSFLKRIG